MASSSSGAVAAPGRGAVFVGSRRLCCEGLSSPPHGSPARRLPQGPRAAESGPRTAGPGFVAEACSSPAQGPALSAPCVALLGVELGVRRVGLADGVQRVRLSVCDILSVPEAVPSSAGRAVSCGSAPAAPFPRCSALRAGLLSLRRQGTASVREGGDAPAALAHPVASAMRTHADSDAGTPSGGRQTRRLAGPSPRRQAPSARGARIPAGRRGSAEQPHADRLCTCPAERFCQSCHFSDFVLVLNTVAPGISITNNSPAFKDSDF